MSCTKCGSAFVGLSHECRPTPFVAEPASSAVGSDSRDAEIARLKVELAAMTAEANLARNTNSLLRAEVERLTADDASMREILEDIREEIIDGQRGQWKEDPLMLAVIDTVLKRGSGASLVSEVRRLRTESDQARADLAEAQKTAKVDAEMYDELIVARKVAEAVKAWRANNALDDMDPTKSLATRGQMLAAILRGEKPGGATHG